jgi:hypothetical protein
MTAGARASAIVAAIGIALGAIGVYLGGSMLYERIAYGSAGVSSSGEVRHAERLWLRELVTPFGKRKLWRIAYEFRTGKGELVSASGTYIQSTAMADAGPGYKVRVLYMSDDPSSSYVEDAWKTWDGLLYLGIGLFVWFVVGAFVWWEIKQARRRGQERSHVPPSAAGKRTA